MSLTVRTTRCRDCAFHPKSPESEYGSGPLALEGGSIIDALELRLKEDGVGAEPFFCHDALPCVDNGGWRAVKRDARIVSLDVCAGWAVAYRRIVGEPFR